MAEEDKQLRVIRKDGERDRECIWVPTLSEHGVPIEGKGVYVAQSMASPAEPGDIAILLAGSQTTGWHRIKVSQVQALALALLTRSRETKDEQ